MFEAAASFRSHTRRALWIARAGWLAAPLLVGDALAAATDGRSDGVRMAAVLLAWTAWLAGVGALAVPRTVTLTAIRLVGPAVALGGTAAGIAAGGVAGVAAVGGGIALAVVVSLPVVADAFVDGSSYGDERRTALRTPAIVAAGPSALAWLACAASVTAGPLLLGARRWVPGAALVVIGVPVAVAGVRRLHQLSRRWLVFVPAGMVVHDPLVLVEPVLVPRTAIDRLGPAEVGTAALDATGGASGLILEIALREPVDVGLRTGRGATEHRGVTALAIAPARPGTAIEVARSARIPIG